MIMNSMPHELIFGEIYLPPLLLAVAMAYLLTTVVTTIGAKLGWYKYIAIPAIAELSLLVIFTGAISQLILVV